VPERLCSWREILTALKRKNNSQSLSTVKRLNKSMGGPIKTGGRGAQPQVDKAKLLAWWCDLDRLHEEQQQRRQDSAATVENRHNYGRNGEVVPDISGGVKRRRRAGPKGGT
jgi:hypothetical protein